MRNFSSVLLFSIAGVVALAQEQGPDEEIHFQHRAFKVPFRVSGTDSDATLLHLYVSKDKGANWKVTASAAPEDKEFRVFTEKDGRYWFAVQALDKQGKANPTKAEQLVADLKLVVDTLAPKVELRPLAPRQGEIGVAWKVSDDNLDLTSFRLEYKRADEMTWLKLAMHPGKNEHYWDPQSKLAVEVRLRARDRAGNTTTVSISLPPHQ